MVIIRETVHNRIGFMRYKVIKNFLFWLVCSLEEKLDWPAWSSLPCKLARSQGLLSTVQSKFDFFLKRNHKKSPLDDPHVHGDVLVHLGQGVAHHHHDGLLILMDCFGKKQIKVQRLSCRWCMPWTRNPPGTCWSCSTYTRSS